MPSYTLIITIDPESWHAIEAAGEKVVITKLVGGVNATIAWVAFNPWPRNVVNWHDDYVVYASTSQVQQGAVINQSSSILASRATGYSFADQLFSPCSPIHPLGPGTYEVLNHDNAGPLTFGLAQAVSINSRVNITPIFAQSVLPGQWLDMTPYDIIQVYLQANVSNGMVVGTVQGSACTVSFGGPTTNQTIAYNSATGGFQLFSTRAPALRRAFPRAKA